MKREPTEAQVDKAARLLVTHMRAELEAAGMDTSPEAVKLACNRRLRARVALQALTASAPAAVDASPPAA